MSEDDFYAIQMTGGVFVEVYETLDEVAFPEQQSAVLSRTQHFTVGKPVEGGHVGQFHLSEFGDITFKLQAREGPGNLPEPDVSGARTGEDIILILGKADPKDLLTEGLGL